ncbi:MAG: hypothetical protein HOP20_10495, partial [Sulfuriferula sp.]|nr:hypothetical protein [Sulfuriferula sp.]
MDIRCQINKAWFTGVCLCIAANTPASAGEWSAEMNFDYRYFLKPATVASLAYYQEAGYVTNGLINYPALLAAFGVASSSSISPSIPATPIVNNNPPPGQEEPSVVLKLQYFNEWDNKTKSFTFKPFFRVDNMDDERTHFDIREAVWYGKYGTENHPWEVKLGIDKVFWGTAESHHLDDIINQTDLVEDINFEHKLGQPMARLTLQRDWGTFDFFVLPWFRERTFTGINGRLHPPGLSLATLPVLYESSDGASHVDYAAHWSKTFGRFDVAVSQFIGTNRDPRASNDTNYRTIDNPTGLVLNYDQMEQTGLDLSAIAGDWIFKLEALRRNTNYAHYWAAVAGIEYPFNNIFKTPYDLSAFVEYNYDS